MTPSPDFSFWSHVPNWAWPIIVAGILGFFIYELIKASESVAQVFGGLGRRIHDRAITPGRTLKRLEHIEQILQETTERLECATAYLAMDAGWHYDTEIIIAETYPSLTRLLPKRDSFSEFSRRWKEEGWRP